MSDIRGGPFRGFIPPIKERLTDVASRGLTEHLQKLGEEVRAALPGRGTAAYRKLQRLSDLCGRLMDATQAGAREADRRDHEAALAREASARLLAENLARLVYLGTPVPPETFSILGWDERGRPVAISRDGGQILMAMGALGSGKSHLALALCESCLRPIPGITSTRHRRSAGIVFHTNLVNNRLPDLLDALRKNPRADELEILQTRLGVLEPAAIARMVLVIPRWLIPEYEEALRPYIALGLRVLPLQLRLCDLSLTTLEALIGGGDAQYLRRMLEVAREQGDQLTIAAWHRILDEMPGLDDNLRARAQARLRLLEDIAGPADGPGLWDLVEPDTLTIFLFAGRRIGRHDVQALCVALLCALSEPSPVHGPFQRVFVLDEINRFDRNSTLWPALMQVARQIRHQGSMLLLMGQDFKGVPDEMLALATVFAVFRLRSPKIFDDVRERVAGYSGRDFHAISLFRAGVAEVAVAECTDPDWPAQSLTVSFRPLCCMHGGFTKAEI